MMKKREIVLHIFTLFLLTFLTSFGYSDEQDIGVDVEFCNPTSDRFVLSGVEVGQQEDVCISLKNLDDKEKFLKMHFVDASIEPVSPHRIVCELTSDKRDGFSRFAKFTRNREKYVFSLGPNSVFQVSGFFTVPRKYFGPLYGCLVVESANGDYTDKITHTIQIDTQQETSLLDTSLYGKGIVHSDTAFNVESFVRNKTMIFASIGAFLYDIKYHFLSFFGYNPTNHASVLSGKEYRVFRSSDMEILRQGNENDFVIQRRFKNNSSFPLELSIASDISYKTGVVFFSEQKQRLNPFGTILLETPVGRLPEYYHGNFVFQSHITYKPIIPGQDIDQPFVLRQRGEFFVFPVGIGLFILTFGISFVLLFILFLKEFLYRKFCVSKNKAARRKPRRKKK